MVEKKGWKTLLPGGLTEAGSSKNFKTGDWRSRFPVRNEKCIHCLMCVAYCPEDCILVQDGKMSGYNYDYCKGCGICSKVCPVHAISMHDETKLAEYQQDPAAFMKKLEASVATSSAPSATTSATPAVSVEPKTDVKTDVKPEIKDEVKASEKPKKESKSKSKK